MKSTIYTLELENGKYYVGRTNVHVPKKRILKHFHEEGSKWTKLHKPIRILSQLKGDEFDEEKYTLIAMENYGIDNVRGGSYCKIELPQHEKDKARQTILSITDKCYKCCKKGHFAEDCDKDRCIKNEDSDSDDGTCCACGGSGVSYWSDGIYGSCMECSCINCGKKDRECLCRENKGMEELAEEFEVGNYEVSPGDWSEVSLGVPNDGGSVPNNNGPSNAAVMTVLTSVLEKMSQLEEELRFLRNAVNANTNTTEQASKTISDPEF